MANTATKKRHSETKSATKKFDDEFFPFPIRIGSLFQEMTEFKLANKKPSKATSSSQVLTPSSSAVVPQTQHNEPQPMRIHPDVSCASLSRSSNRFVFSQPQQYAPSSYQMPPYNPMQSFPNQNFTQMNNFQDNGTTTYSHYNGYSLPMPPNNVGNE